MREADGNLRKHLQEGLTLKSITMLLVLLSIVAAAISIRVGVYDDYPLCYYENGKAKGFYVDILNYIAERERWKIKYIYEKDPIGKLRSGEIDALVAIAYTPERSKVFAFNEETFLSNWGVVVTRGRVEKIFDLSGMNIVLVKNDVYASGFLNLIRGFKVKPEKISWVDAYEDALKILSSGKADAAVVSRIAALMYRSKYRYHISPIIFTPVELKMAFSRSFPFTENVVARIDEYLRKMKPDENSFYWKTLQKYLLEEREFPVVKFLVTFSAILAVLVGTLLYLVYALSKRDKTLRIASENLKAANEQIKAMDSQIQHLYKELQRNFEKFQDVMEIVASMSTFTMEEEEFLEKILHLALDLIPKARYGSVSILDGERWRFIAAVGHDIDVLKSLHLKRKYAFLNLQNPTVIDHVLSKDEELIPQPEYDVMKNASKPIRSSLIAPLKIGENLIGFFSLDIPEESKEEFSSGDVDLADKFAKIVSGFYTVRKSQELESSIYRDIVIILAKALEYYDIYTRGHSERVANLSAKLARRLGMPREKVNRIYWAALVHDIGKIYIPQSVLNKPSKLTSEEYKQIKEHPVKGYEMLKESAALADLAVIVLYHHERCDGSGYPEGLKCEQIPIESRIIAVADAFDAMTSARAYREPLSKDQAIVEILKNAGTQFDPDVVEVFAEMVEEMKKEKLNRASSE